MKRRAHIFALVILLFCVALLVACGKRREKPTLSPSDAHTQVFDSVMTLIGKGAITSEAEFDSTRNSLSASIIWKVRSDGLQGESRLRYAQLLLWSGSREKARRIFEDIRTCKDKYASESWKELITMDIEAERYANAEASMKEYRVTFPPDTSDLKYLFSPCVLLCDRYSEANRPDAAIRVCEDELNAMPADAPYQSF
ncbi:MAG TPA: hypothetical protein VMT60_01350, partial [Candidatus Bathyarchaeia archaeon]|nr:hypothetical protein [Candidatus Bathyarchaeia archaeon]